MGGFGATGAVDCRLDIVKVVSTRKNQASTSNSVSARLRIFSLKDQSEKASNLLSSSNERLAIMAQTMTVKNGCGRCCVMCCR